MTVNLTHPRPDARLDSSRTGNTPGARREEQTAAPAAPTRPPRARPTTAGARRRPKEAKARRPRAVASPGSTPPAPPALGALRFVTASRFPGIDRTVVMFGMFGSGFSTASTLTFLSSRLPSVRRVHFSSWFNSQYLMPKSRQRVSRYSPCPGLLLYLRYSPGVRDYSFTY